MCRWLDVVHVVARGTIRPCCAYRNKMLSHDRSAKGMKERFRHWANWGILITLLLDLSLGLLGMETLCRQCGDRSQHYLLMSAGLIAWTLFLLFDRRVPRLWRSGFLGLLCGVHAGLVGYLVAIPRMCITCMTVAALALLCLFTIDQDGHELDCSVGAMLCSMIGVHILFA